MLIFLLQDSQEFIISHRSVQRPFCLKTLLWQGNSLTEELKLRKLRRI